MGHCDAAAMSDKEATNAHFVGSVCCASSSPGVPLRFTPGF